jgi:hypothetical protein
MDIFQELKDLKEARVNRTLCVHLYLEDLGEEPMKVFRFLRKEACLSIMECSELRGILKSRPYRLLTYYFNRGELPRYTQQEDAKLKATGAKFYYEFEQEDPRDPRKVNRIRIEWEELPLYPGMKVG